MNAFLYRLAEKVRRNEPIPFPLAALLEACTPAVRIGMWARRRQARVRVPARVVSFGNITAGGTGKTPAVIERARQEIAAARKVAVLTRGYGSKQGKELIVATPSTPIEDLYGMLGDEGALILRNAPGVIVVKCADRVTGARAAIGEHGCDTLLLDDGFQYVRIERDENIVVIDATNPVGNGRLIPRGILREPVKALRRATAFLLTRCDQVQDFSPLIETLGALCPDVPIRTTRHAPKHLSRLDNRGAVTLEFLRGKPVKALCAIAHPEAFFTTLEQLGARITERIALPDHAEIPAAAMEGEGITVITEKDAVRLGSARSNMLSLHIELEDYP
jgi:tetraacyldisaccharide 4'-kinase